MSGVLQVRTASHALLEKRLVSIVPVCRHLHLVNYLCGVEVGAETVILPHHLLARLSGAPSIAN